jgi:hypothetical protein
MVSEEQPSVEVLHTTLISNLDGSSRSSVIPNYVLLINTTGFDVNLNTLALT